MVSNTRLALILILLCLITQSLIAQSDDEPLILRDFVMNVPTGWARYYEPPELIFVGELDTNGRITLLSILDDKQELRDLLEQSLASYQLKDRNLPGGVRRFKVALKQETPIVVIPAETAPIPEPPSEASLKQRIDDWILEQKQAYDLFKPPHHGRPPFSRTDYNYHGIYMQSGLDDIDEAKSRLGFEQPATLFSSTLYDSYYRAFYHQDDAGDYANRVYPFHIALSDLQAGLGDFEHRFARGSIAKNELFGVSKLYYSMGYLVQNGFWEQQNSAQTSMKHHLAIPLYKKISLEAEYADFARDVSMSQLKSAWWQSSLYTIDHGYEHLFAALRNPIADIELLRVRETAASALFHTKLKSSSTQLKASRSFALFGDPFTLGYEHLQSERNFTAMPDHENKLKATYVRDGKSLNAKLKAELNDFESYLLDAELSLPLGAFHIGGKALYRADQREPLFSAPDIYDPTAIRQLGSKSLKSDLGGAISFASVGDISMQAAFGQRTLTQSQGFASGNISDDYPYLYGTLALKLNKSLGNYLINLDHDTLWQQEDDILREHPQWQTRNTLLITRVLPYNNAIFAGLGILGHTEYRTLDPSAFLVETSAALDLWAGVRITNLFELSVAFKNISDASMFGVYPIPASLHASIRWFYLN